MVGGSDGTPKVYRIFRETARKIGDDANLIRKLPAMRGRVFSVAVSRDGTRIAAGSALNNTGQVLVSPYAEADPKAVARIKAIESKPVKRRKPEDKAELDRLPRRKPSGAVQVEIATAGVYAVAFQPDGKVVAAAGSDGVIRLLDTADGKVIKEYAPAPLTKETTTAAARGPAVRSTEPPAAESLPPGTVVVAVDVLPKSITLTNPYDYVQLLVMGRLASGESFDAARSAEFSLSGKVAEVDRGGVVRPLADGQAELTVRVADKSVTVPVTVTGQSAEFQADFVRDVTPILSRLGCNQGTCHGSAKGKNGFKLSLRGYDPLFDVRALTDDLASRRVNVASPDDSLMLLKSTGSVPHVGGQLIRPGEPYYEVLRDWIAGGARLNTAVPRVTEDRSLPDQPRRTEHRRPAADASAGHLRRRQSRAT